ncbi:hypothetical protein DICPUDRAFT_55210 [Dictyostelium purpureum]|uniref:GATA-type domain-containing protein n=1 Tax=Dictyostelium purpureum TaxID=5786 RepID=F0ZKW9_DICPU|nr:uncharacterized protein DICPUDRAFT_55210 [Dictyostelium purpureum]EGC35387.1 hypothetical protein DICPUDRAFT_55210 [Dictyostelium purpureum]|eukprot:XP_003288063.1 hypothetical protein DICPUDRAFT_55210 [Dictyostelium purpureum]
MSSSFLLYSGNGLQNQPLPFAPKDLINNSNNGYLSVSSSINPLSLSLSSNSNFSTPLNTSNNNSFSNSPLSTSTGINNCNNNNNNNNNIELIDIEQSLKHCGCRNAKELIQLIRSDAIENLEVSWPDDMGLWYMNTIKSHEVSLQNLVEGVKVGPHLLLLDPTSARYDLSKKQKTIVVRSTNINAQSNNLSSEDDDCYEDDEIGEDGEVVRSPQSKFSLLLDESEKFRKNFKKSSRSAFKKKNSAQYTGGVDQQQPSSYYGGDFAPNTPPSVGPTKLGKRSWGSNVNQSSQQPSQPSQQQNGVQPDEDLDASWLEEIISKRNRQTPEVVPDTSNYRSPSPSLGSSCGSSSPGLGDESPNSVAGGGSSVNTSTSSLCPPGATIDSAERAILEGQIHLPPLLRPRQYHACKTPKEDRPQKRRKNHTSLFCRHCGTTDTPEWRRGPDGRKSLCNACGLHYSKLVKREHMAVPQMSRTFELSEILNPIDN